ncbi:hypothetical protein CPLU01_01039 [Colletotrichum plurivorum]|uniref:Uncharacterized protein n=1 Tax=Colletotrichum plurivorum TaxID=2175906 RepID=A0A8H6NQI3_9PEZI|nr:hypothetical protein CPLU01_01039 [Colletotrichum plurivorum]
MNYVGGWRNIIGEVDIWTARLVSFLTPQSSAAGLSCTWTFTTSGLFYLEPGNTFSHPDHTSWKTPTWTPRTWITPSEDAGLSPLWTLPWQYHHPVKLVEKPCDPSLWQELFIYLDCSRLDEHKQDFCFELDARYSSTGSACGHHVYSLPWDMTSGGSKDAFFSSTRASVDQPSLGMSSTNEESSHYFQGSTRKELLSATSKDTPGFHVERMPRRPFGTAR